MGPNRAKHHKSAWSRRAKSDEHGGTSEGLRPYRARTRRGYNRVHRPIRRQQAVRARDAEVQHDQRRRLRQDAITQGCFRLPDPPQRDPDEMTSYDHLHKLGNSHHLIQRFGNPETTLVEAERWIIAHPDADRSRARRPDLLIAFGVDPEAYEASNGYVISEQGKPPDFVMEIASESTARTDVVEKRVEYAGLGIPEYWRFDETGEHHGARLGGDRLVNGRYEPMPIHELPDGSLAVSRGDEAFAVEVKLRSDVNSGHQTFHAAGSPA